MNWFRRFMTGRYGSDQLNMALLALSLILMLLGNIHVLYFLVFIAYVPIIFAFWRMFSHNIYKRQAENAKFMKIWAPVKNWIKTRWIMLRQSREYRFFTCPTCKTVTRVPRGRGKIEIRCPHCGTKFTRKS